jgi:hypothetical protein
MAAPWVLAAPACHAQYVPAHSAHLQVTLEPLVVRSLQHGVHFNRVSVLFGDQHKAKGSVM